MKSTIGFTDPAEREALAKQYQPLVYKIVRQQLENTPLEFNDVLGFAQEGLVKALNNYNPKSSQTFKQYAAYCILYGIQNGTNNYGHTVKFSAYMQKKVKEAGQSTWIMKSIDIHTDDEGNEHSNIPQPSCEQKMGYDEIFGSLFDAIETKFTKRDCDIFYQVYGLKDFDIVKGTLLAKKYKCSATNITLICKKIIKFIQSDPDLLETLEELL